ADAAVRDRRLDRDGARNALALPLPRFAPRRPAEEPRAPLEVHQLDASRVRTRRVPRDRDADPDQGDARRSARLSRAEPRASGRVLRASAIAPDLQAALDGRR